MNLATLRKEFAFPKELIARHADIAPERLEAIEQGAPPSPSELKALARVYGLDAALLAQNDFELARADYHPVLTFRREFEAIEPEDRLAAIRMSRAARDLMTVRRLFEPEFDPRKSLLAFRDRLPIFQKPRSPDTQPWEQGRTLAQQVRQALSLGEKPIDSLSQLMARHFPEVAILGGKLGKNGPSGITFADDARGVTIVLNLEGKNISAPGRRISLAHELCHTLLDWQLSAPLCQISRFLDSKDMERALSVEQRANSFAARLLCPESAVNQFLDKYHDAEQAAEALMKEFGLNYSAIRWLLWNVAHVSIPPSHPRRMPVNQIAEDWAGRERTVTNPAPSGLPAEERMPLLSPLALLRDMGAFKDTFSDMLEGLSPKQVEQLLDASGDEERPVMTVTGLLRRVEEAPLGVTLFSPSLQREIPCSGFFWIPPEIRSAVDIPVQVTGRVHLDEQGHPGQVMQAVRIQRLDLESVIMTDLDLPGLRMNSPLVLTPEMDAESGQYLCIVEPELGLHVFAQTREQLVLEISEQLNMLWGEYACAEDALLNPEARRLKQALRSRFIETPHAQG